MNKHGEKGISTVAGSVLFIILIFTLQTALFLAVYRYNSSVQDAIKAENDRIQEKIILSAIVTDNSTGVENVYSLMINNTGSITVRIRAIYIDNRFLCDPSSRSINPDDTYVNAKETSWILMPTGVRYNPISKITISTERGTKSTDYEWKLKQGGGQPSSKFDKFYLGPLMLDFTKFYYAMVNPQTGALISEWRPGWSVDAGTGAIAWNITVKDIDDRDITINQFSVFTLVPNDQPSSRRPWYMEPPTKETLTLHIKSNETVSIRYMWTTPKTNQTKNPNTQNIYTTECRTRIFLAFFGIFHEHDGTTKPYGQTIPFEAVLVQKPATIQVWASPTVIVIKSTMNSTITAVVKRGTAPIVGANLTFTTTAGSLSSPWAISDATGTAKVYLDARAVESPTTAMVTVTWGIYSGSTTVSLTVETLTVSASPTMIATNSTMNSTIVARVTAGGTPVVGVNVTFTTNASSLSLTWAITDVAGTARVYLNAPMSPAIANVTAKWINTLGYTTVRFTNLYVTTDRQIYARNDLVMISGLLRYVNGTPVSGVLVSINVTASSGTVIWSVNSTQTDSEGAFTCDLQLVNATPDTYTIIATYQPYEEKYHTFTVR